MRKRTVVKVFLVLFTALGLYSASVWYHANSGLALGQDLLDHQLWPQAREAFSNYLWLHPNDWRARLLMAEAIVNDAELPTRDAAVRAIEHLAEIPNTSTFGAEARLRQARLSFLILSKPAEGEELLHKAIDIGEDDLPAYRLLWTILDVTGRSESTEDIFWKVYELSPENERALRLREWYMRVFFPLTANETLDQLMGIVGPNEIPNRTTESRRYLSFRASEPQAINNHVAMAQWFYEERDPKFAIHLLDAASKELKLVNPTAFFLYVDIAAKIDLGLFDEAEEAFLRWPKNDRSYRYWKTRAIILDDVKQDHQAAIEAYEEALALWPGPVEWRLQYRKAACLTRLNMLDESEAARQRAEQVKELMAPEVHNRLRNALGFLEDKEKLREIIQFYRALNRNREADCWEKHAERL